MTTDELIRSLREQAEQYQIDPIKSLLDEAADKLEAMDERIHIMSESMDSQWGKEY